MNLTEYMSDAIERIVTQAMDFSAENTQERDYLMRFYQTQKTAAEKRMSADIHIPSFLIASIATQCNLKCKGCYARANDACGSNNEHEMLSATQWDNIYSEAAELGIPFILLAGGEPLTRRDVLNSAAKHKDIMFPVFTNGTMFESEYMDLFNEHRNLLPIISLEGDGAVTDERRGLGVYAKLQETMNQMNARGILYGVSITVTKENLDMVSGSAFISKLYQNGCKLAIFVEYVPVDEGTEHLAPTDKEREVLTERGLFLKKEYPNMLFLAFPGDEAALGGCLAAGRGFFHISATGAAEPCPFSPFSDMSMKDKSLYEALQSPLFRKLNDEGFLQAQHQGGCVLYERKDEIMSICK